MGLLQLFRQEAPPAWRFPEGRVGFAIGDIHGRVDLLGDMLATLEARADAEARDGAAPILVFLGDYIDRGPQSAAVLDMLLEGRPRGFERRYLKGNHEQAMLDFIAAPLANRGWMLHGGAETVRAYGLTPPPAIGGEEQMWLDLGAQLAERVPVRHLAFLESLERYVVLGDYLFVHAGVDPSRPLEAQADDDLLWAREKFIASKRRFSHRIVHGHTPVDQPYADHRRIAVDTGAYASGVLSAARFEGEGVSFLSVNARAR